MMYMQLNIITSKHVKVSSKTAVFQFSWLEGLIKSNKAI